MNEKKFVFAIILAISITVIISAFAVANSLSENNEMALDYTVEENASKAKLLYDELEMKNEFLSIAKTLSDNVYSMLLDGTVVDDAGLNKKISSYNSILATDNWNTFGLEYPENWLGKWYLNKQGIVKFKFASKEIEPGWINDSDVVDYIEVN
ncbi:MAG: hypothetical protein IKV94_06020 [Clostridia bacterium]|nr:hypothetical protein [Clostridia bacterium]